MAPVLMARRAPHSQLPRRLLLLEIAHGRKGSGCRSRRVPEGLALPCRKPSAHTP